MDFWDALLNAAKSAINVDAKDLMDLGNEQKDLSGGDICFLEQIPTGARIAYIEAEGQNVRWCCNEGSPSTTVGVRLLKDNALWYQGELGKLRFHAETNTGAKLNVAYYK